MMYMNIYKGHSRQHKTDLKIHVNTEVDNLLTTMPFVRLKNKGKKASISLFIACT